MGGGGKKAKTPVLINDNLFHKQFYRVLDLVSEGPIYGPVDQEHISSFMLNKTPVTNPDGSININGVSVAWRHGALDQDPINGFNAIESTVMVNTDVKYDTPIVRTVSDPDVTRVRFNVGVSQLVESDNQSNQKNTTVQLRIDVRYNGTTEWHPERTVTITGKISGEYLEAHTINAPDVKPFDIRVVRVTPDSTSDLLINDTIWNSYVEIIDDNLSYPYCAVAGMVIDHDQYADTPARTYHLRGLIVPVPDNYDPINRTYSGLWLGGFKDAWTNNPAWLFRELIKNERFGLAKRAGYIEVDDGALYQLSQYCDQMVSDGYGGLEPRLTLNAYLTEQTTARDLLDKIAGMFRGIALWDGQRLTVMIDAPQDPIATITNANVVDGKITRSSIPRAERYNAVIVSWTDPNKGWDQNKEYVADDELIAKDGYNETTLEAFGCTSRGQAHRAGKWLIETAKREPSLFKFQMARDAIHFTPGDVVELLDNNRAGARLGGRIVANNGAVITLDGVDSSLIKNGDTISLMDSDGKFKKHQIVGVDSNNVTLAAAPAWIRNGTVFAISTESVKPILCRITSIAETENNSVYSIEAAQHDPNKQAVVDEGAKFEISNDTLNHYRVPNIENLKIRNVGSETVQVSATWETVTTSHKLSFELYVYNENEELVAQYETDKFRYDFYGLDAGRYILGVRGRNDTGMKGAESQVDLIIGAPKQPDNVAWIPGVFQATLIPSSVITLTSDTTYEFWFAGEHQILDFANIEQNAQFMGRGYQWTIGDMKTGVKYYAYVRTKNAFGYSPFVEAAGKPTEDFSDISNSVLDDVLNSEQFKDMISDITEITGDVDQLKQDTAEALEQAQKNQQELIEQAGKMDQIKQDVDINELALLNTKASLQNAAMGMLNNSLATYMTRRTLRAEFKKGDKANAAEITRLDTVIADEKKATAEALTKLEATFGEEIKATNTELRQAIADGDSALSQQIDSLEATVNDEITASIKEVNKALATHEESNAQSFQEINASLGETNANLTNYAQAQATFEQATTQRLESMTATINGQSVTIQENSQAIAGINGELDAQWSVKLAADANGQKYFSGISLGLTGDGTNMQSQLIFLVDSFVMMTAANGTYETPFYVKNGAMYIKNAWIENGTIDTAKIADWIQSNNFVSGSAGWGINKNGSAEFNQVTIRGTVYANNGSFTGHINATSGSFTGTVQAQSFVGDIVNGYTAPDWYCMSHPNWGNWNKNITYNDNTNNGLPKSVIFMCSWDGIDGGPARITATVNGQSRTVAVGGKMPEFENPNGSRGAAIIAFNNVYGQTISCDIQIRRHSDGYGGGVNGYVRSPTLLIARGTGTFTQYG